MPGPENDKAFKVFDPTLSKYGEVPTAASYETSRYDQDFVIPETDIGIALQGMRASNQGFGMELATAGANLVPNIALSIAETAGYLFDLEDWSNMIQNNKANYGNAITRWASENKNQFGEVYRKSTDGGFDMSDSAWWVSNGGGLVESLVAFGITGFGVGSVLGKSASMLSKTLGAYGKTKMAIEGAAKLGTSLSLAYSEGAMTGAQVFKDVYADTKERKRREIIDQGIKQYGEENITEEYLKYADKAASEFATGVAGESATKAVRINTGINTFLNLPETNVLFRSMGSSRYIDDALKLERGEFARDAVERLKTFDVDKHLTRQGIQHKLKETGSEMLEEMVNVYAEQEGKNVGREATGQDIVSLGDMLADDDIWAAGFWGAVGGSMNGFVMGKMPKWVTQEDGTKKRTTVGAYNKEQVSNKYKEQLTDLQDRLTEFVDARDNLDKASKSGDEKAYKEAADKVFSYNSFNSIVKGTEEQLLNDFQEIAAFTPEQAAQQGFASDYKERATEKMQSVRENTKEWNKIQDIHSSQDLDQAGFPETIFQQHMNVQNNRKIIQENTLELAKLESEISQINTLRGTDLTVTSFNDVLSNIKAVEHTFEMATIDLENILNLDKFDSKTQKRIIAKLSNTYGNIANARQEIEKHLSELNENIADLYNNLEIQKANYYSFIDPDNTMSDEDKKAKYDSTIYQNTADIDALTEGKKTLVGNKKILTSQIEELRVLKSKEGLTRFKELKKEKMAEREAIDAKVAAAAQAAAAAKAEADALAALKAKKQTAPETVTADEEEIIQATTPVESFEEGGYSGEGSSKEELEKQYDDISDVADNSDVPGEVRDSSGALISVGDRLIEGSNKLAYASTVEYTEDASGIKHISLKLNPETNPNLLTDKYVPGTKLKIKKLTAEEFKPFVAEKEISFTDEVGRTILVANAGTTVTFEMLSHPYMQPIGIYNEAGEYQAMLHAVSYITPKRIVPQNVDVDLQTLINIRAAVTDNFQDISINSKSNGKLNQLPQFHRLSELIDQTVEFAIATSSIQLNTSKTTPVENLANKKGYKVGQVYAITVMPDGRKLAIPVKTTKVKETPQVVTELMTALDVFLRGGNREDLQNVFGQYLHSTFTSDKLTEDGKSFLADPNGKDRFYIDFTSKNVKGIIFGRSGATKNFISGDSPASDIEKLKAALASIIQESYININFESLKNPDFVKKHVTSNVRFYPLPNGKVTVFDNPVIGFDTSNLLNATAPAAKVAPTPAPVVTPTTTAELEAVKQVKPATTPTTQPIATTLQVHPSITKEKERLKKILSKLEYKVPDSSGIIRLNSDGSFKEYGSYNEENGGGEWNSVTTDINFSSIKNDYQKVKKIHDTNIKLNDLINSKLVDDINLLVNKYGSLKELKKALEPYSFEQIGSTASLDYDLVGFIQKGLSFNKIDGITKAIEELLGESQPTPVVETPVVKPTTVKTKDSILKEKEEKLANVKPVYHHTSVDPKDFNFNEFQRGDKQVSQFGDGLNASSNTTSFLVNRYGKAIQGEINDLDFVKIDASKTEKEVYEELKNQGYKFSEEHNTNDVLAEVPGAAMDLFTDFQKSNPDVKGVQVNNHIIGDTKVAPFYVIYDAKSFYGQGSLTTKIEEGTNAELATLGETPIVEPQPTVTEKSKTEELKNRQKQEDIEYANKKKQELQENIRLVNVFKNAKETTLNDNELVDALYNSGKIIEINKLQEEIIRIDGNVVYYGQLLHDGEYDIVLNDINNELKSIEQFLATIETPTQPVKIQSANGASFTIRLDEDDDLSITTTEKLSAKEIQELFDSNPELANEVYEALGFSPKRGIDIDFNPIPIKDIVPNKIYNIKDVLSSYLEMFKKESDSRESYSRGVVLMEQLAVLIPNNTSVLFTKKEEYDLKNPNSSGQYWGNSKLIEMPYPGSITTFIHEIIHAVTYDALENDNDFYKTIGSYKRYVRNYISTNNIEIDSEIEYALSDTHEFLTQLFSSKSFIDLLNNIPYKNQSSVSILDKIIDIIKKIVSVRLQVASKIPLDKNSILNSVITDTSFYLNATDSLLELSYNQKQKAIQAYSQYLNSVFSDSKVKDINGFKEFAKSGKQIEKYVSLQDKVNNLIEEGKATKFCK